MPNGYRSNGDYSYMKIAGVRVRHSVISKLALYLQESGKESLATHIGRAWDWCHEEVLLTSRDQAALLEALDGPIEECFVPIREALMIKVKRTGAERRMQDALGSL